MTGSQEPRFERERAAELGLPLFEVWDTIGSTSDRARTLAERGAARGSLVVALEQSAGRGRQGAPWLSRAGDGVWMSLVLADADAAPQLPIVVGVACAEVLEEASGVAVAVKWPNDLVLDGGKVGGVLVERGPDWVVAGIGVNLRAAPSREELAGTHAPVPAVALGDHARALPDAPTLAGALARRVLDRLDADDVVARSLEAFASRDALAGRRVRSDEHGEGVARGIDEDGMLLLELDEGPVVSVRSGSVRLVTRPDMEA